MEENIQPQSPAPVQYASFGRRFLAYFVDGIIIQLLSLLLSLPLGIVLGVSSALSPSGGFNSMVTSMTNVVSTGASLLIGITYFTFFLSKQNGQTLGKKLLAIRVVREDGEKISFSTALVRYVGYLLSALPLFIGFLWMLWDGKKQTLHDKIAKTLVVQTDKKPKTGVALALVGCCLLIPVILGIVAIVAGAALVAINPAEQMNKAKDVSLQTKAQNLYQALNYYEASLPAEKIRFVDGSCPAFGSNALCPVGSYVLDISPVVTAGYLSEGTLTDEELSQLVISAKTGQDIKICFAPKSKTFQKNAIEGLICIP